MFKPKTSHEEFEPSMLPKNRKELFFDVIKLHWGKFLMFGCLMLLFAFPIHAYAIAEDFYVGTIKDTLKGVESIETQAGAYMSILLFGIIRNLVNIPLLVLFSVGLAGMARVIRQYAWGENVDFNHDFVLGIKQNGKQFALIALITGVIAFICHVCMQFNDVCILLKLQGVDSIEPNDAYDWISIIPVAVCAVFFIPIAGYALVSGSCYENSLKHNLKIGRVCYFRYLWKTILACVCCLAVFVIQLIPFFWTHLIGRLVGSLLIPEIMLGWYLFAFGRLDEVVNKKLHPELVKKGLYVSENAEQPQCVAQSEEETEQIEEGLDG